MVAVGTAEAASTAAGVTAEAVSMAVVAIAAADMAVEDSFDSASKVMTRSDLRIRPFYFLRRA